VRADEVNEPDKRHRLAMIRRDSKERDRYRERPDWQTLDKVGRRRRRERERERVRHWRNGRGYHLKANRLDIEERRVRRKTRKGERTALER
jgi:hypothetical protein